jgi:hypothetical protein
MRAANILVFDEIVQATSTGASLETKSFYTDQSLNDRLGVFDMLALMAVVDALSGTGKLWVQIEHSADGRNWLSKSTDAEIGGATAASASPKGESLSGTAQQFFAGGDNGGNPSLAFVRLRVDLQAPASASVGGRVRVFVTGRNWGR